MTPPFTGSTLLVLGDRNPVLDAAAHEILAHGATPSGSATPTLVLAGFPLLPDESEGSDDAVLDALRSAASAMAAGRGGRVAVLFSALGVIPARRFPRFSARTAAVAATVRTLAMTSAPSVLVNAVAVGAVEDGGGMVSGDAAFLRHASVPRAGTAGDVAAAILFLLDPLNTYTTGQVLAVDGGWSAGYGRSF